MPSIWRPLTFGCASLIALFSLLPAEAAVSSGFGDKLEHFGAFALLSVLARLGWPGRDWRQVAGILVAFGAMIELTQSVSPGRHPDVYDWLADAIGVAVGLGTVLVVRRIRSIGSSDSDNRHS